MACLPIHRTGCVSGFLVTAATYAYARNRKSRNRPLEAASPLHWRFLRTARRQTGPVP